jgi:hypothetical protein
LRVPSGSAVARATASRNTAPFLRVGAAAPAGTDLRLLGASGEVGMATPQPSGFSVLTAIRSTRVAPVARRPLGFARLGLPLGWVLAAAWASTAYAGVGEGFFCAKGPERIPDGHGGAKLRIHSILPTDIDPTIDYVSVSLRVNHPQTRDLIVRLRRPNFIYMGSPQSSIPIGVTLSDRDTHGKNLGRGKCFESNPGFAPDRLTTLNDSGGPPPPRSARRRLHRHCRAGAPPMRAYSSPPSR